MKMVRFLLDENVNQSGYVQERCHEYGLEVDRVHGHSLVGAADSVIFEMAFSEGFVIVTGNIYEFRAFQQVKTDAGELTPGAIYIPAHLQKNTELIIRRIVEVALDDYYEGGEWWVRK